MNKEMALLHRVNENGRVETVRLVSTTSQKKADGYYVLNTYTEGSYHFVSSRLVPVTIIPTGEVFLGEPSLRYVNDIIDQWSNAFVPNLQAPSP